MQQEDFFQRSRQMEFEGGLRILDCFMILMQYTLTKSNASLLFTKLTTADNENVEEL